jgi:recombination protein RecA
MSKPKTKNVDAALETMLKGLERRFGTGIVMRLGDAEALDVESIPTGSLSLDIALGIGGVPTGRIIEVYGQESSGKTTLCLHVIAEAQKLGHICGFVDVEHAIDPEYAKRIGVDVEHAIDPEYAKRIGVDVDNLYVSQPDTGEQALEVAEGLISSGTMKVVVVDSVAALVPRAEIEGEMGDSHMGLQARLMSQALRKITGPVSASGTTLIFTNQIRQKIGVLFGNPETTSGGMALKFYASMRLETRRLQALKEGNVVVGNRTRVSVRKNKVAPPFRQAEFDIMYTKGIDAISDILDLAEEYDLVERRGAYYRYNDELLGQGRNSAVKALEDQPDVVEALRQTIKEKTGLVKPVEPEAAAEEAA